MFPALVTTQNTQDENDPLLGGTFGMRICSQRDLSYVDLEISLVVPIRN